MTECTSSILRCRLLCTSCPPWPRRPQRPQGQRFDSTRLLLLKAAAVVSLQQPSIVASMHDGSHVDDHSICVAL